MTRSIHELIEAYRSTAIAWDVMQSNAKKANSLFREIHDLHKELRDSEPGRKALSHLMDDPAVSPGVHLLAASHSLGWEPEHAVRVLEAIERLQIPTWVSARLPESRICIARSMAASHGLDLDDRRRLCSTAPTASTSGLLMDTSCFSAPTRAVPGEGSSRSFRLVQQPYRGSSLPVSTRRGRFGQVPTDSRRGRCCCGRQTKEPNGRR